MWEFENARFEMLKRIPDAAPFDKVTKRQSATLWPMGSLISLLESKAPTTHAICKFIWERLARALAGQPLERALAPEPMGL